MRWIYLSLAVLGGLPLFGQNLPITITTVVPEPVPVFWDDYLDFRADVFIYLTNTSSETQEIKLVPTITSDAGISFTTRNDFQPSAPIVLAPGSTVPFSFNELEFYNGNLSQNDFVLEGVSWQTLYQSPTLPEGYYTLCFEAFDFLTNAPLSNQFGCDVFLVQTFDPPFILYPIKEHEVDALQPPFINFSWSVAGIPGQTNYEFLLFDLGATNLLQPGDVFINPNIIPYYQEEGLLINFLNYNQAFPSLEEGNTYAVQIRAYDPLGVLQFDQGGLSPIHIFDYVGEDLITIFDPPGIIITETPGGDSITIDPPGGFVNPNDDPIQLSVGDCAAPPAIANTTLLTSPLSAGATVQVGNFSMTVESTDGQNPATGTGSVSLDFLNWTIPVAFQDLSVNTNFQAFGTGRVLAMEDANLLADTWTEDFTNILNPGSLDEATAAAVHTYTQSQGRVITDADWNTAIESPLPVSLQRDDLWITFTGIEFGPEGALFNAIGSVEVLDAIGDRRILLATKGSCIVPNGISEQGNLQLLGDQIFPISAGLELQVIGGGQTVLQWNAEEIEQLNLAAALVFSPTLIETESGPLTATFNAQLTDYQDWTATVELSDETLQLPGLNGFNWQVPPGFNIIYDHSEVSNVPGFQLPDNYPNQTIPGLWQGLSLQNISFNWPDGIDASVDIPQLLLDQEGLWADVTIQSNILNVATNDIENWPFGIDALALDIRASSLEDASFSGSFRLPISGQNIDYNAPILFNGGIQLTAETGIQLEVPMWFADLDLSPSSTITLERSGGNWEWGALLHGQLDIGWSEAVDDLPLGTLGDFDLPSLQFEQLEIASSPGIPTLSGGIFELDNVSLGQASIVGFPLSLNGEPSLAIQSNEVSLDLSIGMNLLEIANGLNGSTSLDLVGAYNPGSRLFEFDRIDLEQVQVEGDLGIMTATGTVDLFQGDFTYGNGFYGRVGTHMNYLDFGIDMQLQVGRTLGSNGFRYCFIDVATILPPGLATLGPSGLELAGFGGGFYHNMTRTDNIPTPTVNDYPGEADYGDGVGEAGSGTEYTPSENSMGLKASVVLATAGLRSAFNGDMGFEVGFTTGAGLDYLRMTGDIYVMQPLSDRSNPKFINMNGQGLIEIATQPTTFTCTAGMEFGALGIIEQSAELELFASASDFHVYLGQWTPNTYPINDMSRIRSELDIDLGIAEVSALQSAYFMMGTDLPSGLPLKPQRVEELFPTSSSGGIGNTVIPGMNGQQEVSGFAFGLGKSFDANFNAYIFRLGIGFDVGFDLLLANYANYDCAEPDFGFNQYYATGSGYAYANIEGFVTGKVLGKSGSYKIARVEAGSILDIQTPKPTYLRGRVRMRGEVLSGLIKWDRNLDIELGKQLDCRSNEAPNIFDDIPIVESLDPGDQEKEISIYVQPQIAFNYPKETFAVEYAPDPLEPEELETAYYRYQLVDVLIEHRPLEGGAWQVLETEVMGNLAYDQAGYSAAQRITTYLPELSKIRITVRTEGQQVTGLNNNTLVESFGEQTKIVTFETREAPDYIMAGNIIDARPFERQRYFLKGESGGEGFIQMWKLQPHLFRTEPKSTDDEDPEGTYSYIARFRHLKSGAWRDRPINNPPGDDELRIEFNLPMEFLQPEAIYEIDILRLYTPANQASSEDNTEQNLVELGTIGLSGPGDYGLSASVNNSGQNGLQQTIGFVAINSGGGQSAIGTSPTFGISGEDPAPTPPAGLDLGFKEPGGDHSGLEYIARSIKDRKTNDTEVVKSLMEKKFYFRTSRYTSKAQKVQSFEVYNPGKTPARMHHIAGGQADPWYNGSMDIRVPYILLEVEESLDIFDSHYFTYEPTIQDGNYVEQHPGEKRSPYFEFQNSNEAWDDQYYSSSNLFSDYYQGSTSEWEDHNFQDPDITTEAPGPEDFLCGYHATPERWSQYRSQVSGSWKGDDTRRYRNHGIYGRRLGRSFRAINHLGGEISPTVEFYQFASSTASPPIELSGYSIHHTGQYLSMAEINSELNPYPPGGYTNIGELTIYEAPILPLNVNLQFTGISSTPGSGMNNQSAGMGTFTGNGSYLALVDFTEWVTFKDYLVYRQHIYDGLQVTMDMANSPINDYPSECSGATVFPSTNGSPLPHPWDPDFSAANYDFYHRYYKPITAYFLHGTAPEKADFPYPARPAGSYELNLEGKPMNYQIDFLNQWQPSLN